MLQGHLTKDLTQMQVIERGCNIQEKIIESKEAEKHCHEKL